MGRAQHCTEVLRAIIRNLYKAGKSQREIADYLGRSKTFVFNALHSTGKRELTGRPRKTTPKDDSAIKRASQKDPFKASKQIRDELNLSVSSRTVQRRLAEKGLGGKSPRKVPMLTPKHLKARLKYAKDHFDWVGPEKEKQWRNVLWSDETKVNLIGSDGKSWVHRPLGCAYMPQYTNKTFKHGGGNIMVWGCFSWYGVGPLYWIDRIMDQHLYAQILREVMLPHAEWEMPLKWQFQQDNDPKHTAKTVKKWFQDNKVDVMEWPAQSPDLNPIENLWEIVKRKVYTEKSKNKQQLWERIQAVWYAIPVRTCQKLVESMPNRVREVMRNKGYTTKY